MRVSTTYDEFKKLSKNLVGQLPASVGVRIEQLWRHFKDGVKSTMWPGQIFELMGIKYMGPVDGHDLPGLINILAELKDVNAPVLLHVKTIKGKGCELATCDPTKFHSPSPFAVEGDPLERSDCRVELKKSGGKSWTNAFAEAAIALAGKDPRIVTLTAGMPDGTGLSKFEKVYPDRYFDTGICESHLMGMAAGMAKSGMRPIAAVYSTFTQRAFDQVWQEVALNGMPVVVAMDRAGYVGDDGAVHHGFMDQAFLRPMPGMVLMAPSDELELGRCLRLAVSLDMASALRYPRDSVPAVPFEHDVAEELRGQASGEWRIGRSRVLRQGSDVTLIVYGALMVNAMAAAAELSDEGIEACVIDARFCKPVDGEMIARALRGSAPVLTIEDHSLQNGFGSAVLEYATAHHLPTARLTRLGHPDRLIAHASRAEQLAEVGLDAKGIARSARDAIRTTPSAKPVMVGSEA